MFEVVLFEPEIAANTGNLIRLCANTGCRLHLVRPLGFRLCANTGCRLHLVRPLGFTLQDKKLKRAGLDYHDAAELRQHDDWAACCAFLTGQRLFAVTTRGERGYHEPRYEPGDVFVFGSETRGLPDSVTAQFTPEQRVRVPMLETSRSLNLSNAVAVVVYEAWRQTGFARGR